MSCIAGERLAAYWLGELEQTEADTIEEHAFACDACAAALSKTAAVIAGVRAVLPPVISGARLRALHASTPSLKEVQVPAGGSATVEFGPGDQAFALHLQADLARVERVDFRIEVPDGPTTVELAGVPFDAETGTVIVLCQRHFMAPGKPRLLHMRLRTLRDGEWSESGPYAIDHVLSV
jgi:hypothetical protein